MVINTINLLFSTMCIFFFYSMHINYFFIRIYVFFTTSTSIIFFVFHFNYFFCFSFRMAGNTNQTVTVKKILKNKKTKESLREIEI